MSADSTADAFSQSFRRARVAILENAIGLACAWRAAKRSQVIERRSAGETADQGGREEHETEHLPCGTGNLKGTDAEN
jgi:hypothetical protein